MDAKSSVSDHEHVSVESTKIGQGVFARRPLAADTIVGEIEGHVVSADFESDYCIDLGGKAGMDPLPPYRFLNHSCEPNCEILLWKRRKGCDKKTSRVWLVTTKDVGIGEEFTIDYGWPKESAIPCLCGSAACRGWVVEATEASGLSVSVAD